MVAVETRYVFYRNDQIYLHFDFDPADEKCLDRVSYKYFGRVLNKLHPLIRDLGLLVYVTSWTVHEIPSYGPNVVVCILQDEWSRECHFRDKVGMIFRTCGKWPVNIQSYQYGGVHEKVMNLLAQIKAVSKDKGTRIKTLRTKLSGIELAPVHDLPIGYFPFAPVPYIPIENRSIDLYFAGSVQHLPGQKLRRPKEFARSRMGAALKEISEQCADINICASFTEGFGESIAKDHNSYLENLMNTKICPIPRGANLETYRFYDAIRYGCIPIGESFPKTRFYDDAPIVRLKNWAELMPVVKELLSDTRMVKELHKSVLNWWENVCSEDAVANDMYNRLKNKHSLFPCQKITEGLVQNHVSRC